MTSHFFYTSHIREHSDSFWTLLRGDIQRRHRPERKLTPVGYSAELNNKVDNSNFTCRRCNEGIGFPLLMKSSLI